MMKAGGFSGDTESAKEGCGLPKFTESWDLSPGLLPALVPLTGNVSLFVKWGW